MTDLHRVLVLGAGYAGIPAGKRLARQVRPDEVEVTLINASRGFVERPRLHQLASGQRPAPLDLRDCLVGSGVDLRVGRVIAIDPAARRVALDDGSLDYDTLIYALGSRTDPNAVPGAAELALVLNDHADAYRLADALGELTHEGRVVVCGGGLTGVEVAGEVAESHPHLAVGLVSASVPGGHLSSQGQAYLRTVFDRLGVNVRAGARVAEVRSGELLLEGGSTVPFDVCVWAGGFTVPDLAARAGLEVTDAGRVVVDGTLRSRSHPDVFAIGDAAAVSGRWGDELTMGCRSGGFTGPKVADVVAAQLTGRRPARPLRFRYLHECISLGRRQGLVQFLHADERPTRFVLTGRKAIRYKDATLNAGRLLFRMPGPYRPLRRRHLAREQLRPVRPTTGP